MDNFTYHSPTEFIFGRDTEKEIGKLIRKYKGKKVLVHYGKNFVEKSGLLAKVLERLEEDNIEYITLGGVEANPKDDLVYKGIEICRQEQVNFILALGGGSVIDSAKAIAAGVKYKGDFWDFFTDKAEIEEALPLGVILTIPAAGSEASGNSVITKRAGKYKKGTGSFYLKPRFSILNPEYCLTLSKYQTACGIADMMAHVMERYFTRTPEVEITDRIGEGVLKTLINKGRKIIKEQGSYDDWANLMWAGTLAHNGICGVGRSEDWSSHALEHELSALYDVPHGAGLAVVIPAWMRYVMEENLDRFVLFAFAVWGIKEEDKRKAATYGIEALENFFKEIGLPVTFKELGAKEEDIGYMVEKLRENSGGEIGSFKELDMEDAGEIYKLCCR